MYGARVPSRILNDDKIWFGLNKDDFLGILIAYVILYNLLHELGYSAMALIIIPVLIGVLGPIRAGYRRKSIRDYILYRITRGRHS